MEKIKLRAIPQSKKFETLYYLSQKKNNRLKARLFQANSASFYNRLRFLFGRIEW